METSLANSSARAAWPVRLLFNANALTGWRRLKAIRRQSRLLTAFIGAFLVGYLSLSFWLFQKGFGFVASFPGLGELLMERLLFLLFAFLFLLLIFSNLVICYTNFFRNRETAFLLTAPVSTNAIFQWKFLESTALASWAFIFLIAPLLAAYGTVERVPWHFYPLTILLIALFIILPGTIGAWAALIIGRYLDRRAFQVAAVTTVLASLTAAAFWLKPQPIPDEISETRVLAVLDRLLEKTHFAHFPFLPSYWLSSAVMEWSEQALSASLFFILVLASYVLFFGFLSAVFGGAPLYDAASAVQSRPGLLDLWRPARSAGQTREFSYPAIPDFWERLLLWIVPRPDVRALVLKDIRTFWRDTTQWGQTLVLFGLLGVYILNLRHFTQQLSNPFWVHLVSYLNLAACSLNLATLTTRFVYPQFSLEGKRLWIIGLSPMGLTSVVRTKFLVAATTALVLTLGLITLSCHMLKMPLARTSYFAGAISLMTFTLASLAIGLGVLYPNLKEDNPGKIVSGFGGTFCLVLSFVYIVLSVILLALGSSAFPIPRFMAAVQLAAIPLFLLLSVLLGWVPLQLALRRVKNLELEV